MKLYVCYTLPYKILIDKWFLPSLKDDFNVVRSEMDKEITKGVDYKSEGWFDITKQKVEFVIKAIRDNWDNLFIFSDPDIQFFGRVKKTLFQTYRGEDLLFQKNSPEGVLCTGFFLCKGNNKTLKFWQDVLDFIGEDNGDDQDVADKLLRDYFDRIILKISPKKYLHLGLKLSQWGINVYKVKWGYLPNKFFSAGTLHGKKWKHGDYLEIPKDIILHHANWTVGLKNKIAQLRYVRDHVISLHLEV